MNVDGAACSSPPPGETAAQPDKRPDETIALLAVSLRKSRRVTSGIFRRHGTPPWMLFDECSDRLVRRRRVRRQIMMAFAGQHDQLSHWNCASQLMRGGPVGVVGGAVIFVVADQDERRDADLLQSRRVIVSLARQDEMEIILQRRDAGHSALARNFSISSGCAATNSFVQPVSMVCSRM